ncbi:MAG: hypothetical protein MI974_00185 [Chitinophagales bacterium]|nr:hypothetical protein [Chitinophagales bacterium]
MPTSIPISGLSSNSIKVVLNHNTNNYDLAITYSGSTHQIPGIPVLKNDNNKGKNNSAFKLKIQNSGGNQNLVVTAPLTPSTDKSKEYTNILLKEIDNLVIELAGLTGPIGQVRMIIGEDDYRARGVTDTVPIGGGVEYSFEFEKHQIQCSGTQTKDIYIIRVYTV